MTDANEIERLNEERKVQMLSILAEGYLRAKNRISDIHASQADKRKDGEASQPSTDQYLLL